MTEKLTKAAEQFFKRAIWLNRGYEENVLLKGFHTVRFHAFLGQMVVLTGDKDENREQIKRVNTKLLKACKKQVEADIAEFIAEVKALNKKKRKKKEG